MKHLNWIGLILLFALGIGPALAAQDTMVLLERAIYTEETLGDLNEAIGLYKQVTGAVDATRATSALALFRLGLCYQKSGSAEQAQAAFAKLSKLYPEQQELISQIPAPSSNELAFRPAPWAQGYVLRFVIKLKSGLQVGDLIHKFSSTSDSGRVVWQVQSTQSGGVHYASALIDPASFSPISSLVREGSTGREYQVKYTPQEIEYVVTTDGAAKKKTFPLNRTTYEDQQLILVLRCLTLRVGFQIAIPIFLPGSNDPLVDAKIAVIGKEEITVPAGTFDCYKVILTRGNQSPSSTYWISDDSHFYIVKINEMRLLGGSVRNMVDLELSSVDTAEGKPIG